MCPRGRGRPGVTAPPEPSGGEAGPALAGAPAASTGTHAGRATGTGTVPPAAAGGRGGGSAGVCRGCLSWARVVAAGCSLTLYTTGSLRDVSPGLAVSSSVLPLSTASSPDFFSGSLEPGPPPAPGVPPYPPCSQTCNVVRARLWAARRGRPPSDQAAARGPTDLANVSYRDPSRASHDGKSSINSDERKSGLKGTVEMMEHLSSP